MERNEFLNSVFGYKKIKDELYEIRSWYLYRNLNEEERKEFLPKGILFYGEPGYGKTLLIREFAKSFGYKVFIVEGDSENLDEILAKIYEEARKEKNSIIIIDELDRLVEKDTKLERILQMQLDGYNKNGNILTLASANEIALLPSSLLREGRFDRKFNITIGNNKELKEIISRLLELRGFKLDENEIGELALNFRYESIAMIKSVFNNVYFRYGSNPKVDDFISEINFMDSGYISNKEDLIVKDYIAVHEAGHALYLEKFCRKLNFLRVICNENGGKTYNGNFDSIDDLDTRLDGVEVSLAGLVAEEIIFKRHDIGSSDDLDKAYEAAYRLVNRTMINGFSYYCNYRCVCRKEQASEYENKIFAIKTKKFLKREYKRVKRKLSKYKKEILLIANEIEKNKGITKKELLKILS